MKRWLASLSVAMGVGAVAWGLPLGLRFAAWGARDTGWMDDGAVVWTADEACKGLADGTEISSWYDSAGQFVAAKATTYSGNFPTATNAIWNGHAAISFNSSGVDSKQMLEIQPSDNPLCGSSNFAVVVVCQMTKAGKSDQMWYRQGGILGRDLSGQQNDFQITAKGSAFAFGLGVRYQQYSNQDRTIATTNNYVDGAVHIVMAGMSAPNIGWINVDGELVEFEYPIDFVFDKDEAYGNKRETTQMLYVGRSYEGGAFYGLIGEMRLYANTLMTQAVQNALGKRLAKKYGANWTDMDAAE